MSIGARMSLTFLARCWGESQVCWSGHISAMCMVSKPYRDLAPEDLTFGLHMGKVALEGYFGGNWAQHKIGQTPSTWGRSLGYTHDMGRALSQGGSSPHSCLELRYVKAPLKWLHSLLSRLTPVRDEKLTNSSYLRVHQDRRIQSGCPLSLAQLAKRMSLGTRKLKLK